jgi:hypothetical protein
LAFLLLESPQDAAKETSLAIRKENKTATTPVTSSSLTSSISYQSIKRERAFFVLFFDGRENGEDRRSNKGIKHKRCRGKGSSQGRAKHILLSKKCAIGHGRLFNCFFFFFNRPFKINFLDQFKLINK